MMTLEVVAYAWCALILLTSLMGWYRTAKVFGRVPWDAGLQTLRFMLRTSHAIRLSALAILCLLMLVISLATQRSEDARILWAGTATLVATLIASLLRVTQPPAALILTSSSPRAARVLARANQALAPMRAVALLDSRRTSWLMRGITLEDNLRTRSSQIWKSVVHRLIDLAPIVVIDSRGDSEAVRQEIAVMLDPARARKLVCLTTPDGRCPAFEPYGIEPANHALRTFTEDEFIEQLGGWEWPASKHVGSGSIPAGGRHGPLMPESFANLPSLVMVAFPESFDSQELVRIAASTDKTLIAACGPMTHITEESAQWTIEISWEFAHDPRLVLMILEGSLQVVIRAAFLRKVGNGVDRYLAHAQRGLLTFEQLNQPEPVWHAQHAFASELSRLAEREQCTWRVFKR